MKTCVCISKLGKKRANKVPTICRFIISNSHCTGHKQNCQKASFSSSRNTNSIEFLVQSCLLSQSLILYVISLSTSGRPQQCRESAPAQPKPEGKEKSKICKYNQLPSYFLSLGDISLQKIRGLQNKMDVLPDSTKLLSDQSVQRMTPFLLYCSCLQVRLTLGSLTDCLLLFTSFARLIAVLLTHVG